jgi:flavin reductase (DIM6/NTAB) family NADH-FMN oxidoreductase RutF
MRLLPHSVVVCTSAATTADSTTPVPRGMTMSSFTSLSLRPTPLVTFNIATPSRTLDAMSRSRQFNIHILSGDVAGARVADWFRKGNADDLGVFEANNLRDECGCEVVGKEMSSTTAAPLLKGPGVLFALRCCLLGDEPARGLVRVRDHVIVLAEIVDIIEGQGDKSKQDGFGLAYADRLYRQLGSTMALVED